MHPIIALYPPRSRVRQMQQSTKSVRHSAPLFPSHLPPPSPEHIFLFNFSNQHLNSFNLNRSVYKILFHVYRIFFIFRCCCCRCCCYVKFIQLQVCSNRPGYCGVWCIRNHLLAEWPWPTIWCERCHIPQFKQKPSTAEQTLHAYTGPPMALVEQKKKPATASEDSLKRNVDRCQCFSTERMKIECVYLDKESTTRKIIQYEIMGWNLSGIGTRRKQWLTDAPEGIREESQWYMFVFLELWQFERA